MRMRVCGCGVPSGDAVEAWYCCVHEDDGVLFFLLGLVPICISLSLRRMPNNLVIVSPNCRRAYSTAGVFELELCERICRSCE